MCKWSTYLMMFMNMILIHKPKTNEYGKFPEIDIYAM